MTVLSSTSSVRPWRKTEMSREPSGSLTPPAREPATGELGLDLHLHDLEALLGELEQADEAVLGQLVLDEAEDARRRAHRLLDPEQLEVLLVPRVVHARDRLRDAVALLADLCDHEVVLVVARDREQELRGARDARALEDADLGRVAAHDDRAELVLEEREAVGALLDHRHLVTHLEQRARAVRPDLPAPGDDDVHQAASVGRRRLRLHRLEEHARSPSASGTRCSAPARRRTSRGRGRGRGRRRCGCRSASGGPGR